MLQTELTADLKKRLATIKGQIEGIVKMLDDETDFDKILNNLKRLTKVCKKLTIC